MVFSSITFIFYFLPLVLLCYFIVPKQYRNYVLLVFSLFFYFYGEKTLVILLIFSICFNYYYSKLIEKYHNKYILALGVMVNLGLLVYYKYTNFFVDNLNRLLNLNIKVAQIVLPIGISFFTFQGLSYLVDVYRNDVKSARSVFDFGAYLALFPQLIAGPIVRYETVAKEINERSENIDDFSKGIKRFSVGLFKKIILANSLGESVKVLAAITSKTVLSVWLEAIFATLQIYFDFSAYSDMAIGMGLFFGFHLLENFNYPLIAESITDFWRRWHISLSSWFKDYVYIPLGGSRCSKLRNYFNILVVWLCTGFWHGANWNFIIWGLYFAFILVIEKTFTLKYMRKYKFIGRPITFIIVVLSFVIFNHTSISDILGYYQNMFGMNGIALVSAESIYYFKSYFVLLVISLLAMGPWFKNVYETMLKKYPSSISSLELIGVVFVLVMTTAFLLDASFNPFLYFRF